MPQKSKPTPEPPKDPKIEWANKFRFLIGRTIKSIRYLTRQEMDNLAWYSSAIVIELSDGTLLWPSADDEGNNAGALFLQPSTIAKLNGVPEGAPIIG